MKRAALATGLFLLLTAGTVPLSRANELYIDAVKDYAQDNCATGQMTHVSWTP